MTHSLRDHSLFFLISIFLISNLLFSSFVWKIPIQGHTSSNLVLFNLGYGQELAVASDDGYLSVLDAYSGNIVFEKEMQSAISQIIFLNGYFYLASANNLYVMKNNVLEKEGNYDELYGIDVGSDGIYITDNHELAKLRSDLTKIWSVECSGRKSKPFITSAGVVFICNKELYLVGRDGNVLMRFSLVPTYDFTPIVNNNVLLIGGNEKIYAIDLEKASISWSYTTSGIIVGKPYVENETVYFLSSDENLYAVSLVDGKLLWKKKISGQPTGGIDNIIFNNNSALVISADKYIYLINEKTGAILFSFCANGEIVDFVSSNNTIYYSTIDGEVGAYSLKNRGCSIQNYVENMKIGYRPIEVNGTFFSSFPNPKVMIRITSPTAGEGKWEEANVSKNRWYFLLNPMKYPFGKLSFECKVVDDGGEEEDFSSVFIIRDDTLPKNKLYMHVPLIVEMGKKFKIVVTDEQGNNIDTFKVYAGKKLLGEGNNSIFMTKLETLGTVELTAKKKWFKEYSTTVIVLPPFILLFIGSVILIGITASLIIQIFRKQGELWAKRRKKY